MIIRRAADARAISGAIYSGIDGYGNAAEKAIEITVKLRASDYRRRPRLVVGAHQCRPKEGKRLTSLR